MNIAQHVLGEQRQKLQQVIEWANTQGAQIDNLPRRVDRKPSTDDV